MPVFASKNKVKNVSKYKSMTRKCHNQTPQTIPWHLEEQSQNTNSYSKTCVKRTLSKRPTIRFQDQLSLNAGQKHCRIEHSAILRPSLSYHLPIGSLFCLFLSCRYTQVLLYMISNLQNKATSTLFLKYSYLLFIRIHGIIHHQIMQMIIYYNALLVA